MTQEQRILAHLRERKGLTQLEATHLYGITRLSGRIFDLRAKGYTIVTDRVTSKNRYGEETTYGAYTLIKEPEDVTDNGQR